MNVSCIPISPDRGVPDWWGALFAAAADASIFLSPEWLATWLEVYGSEFSGCWVRWSEADRVVGGCLLVERVISRRGIPLRTLFVNATGEATQRSPLAEYNDLLALPGHHAALAEDLARLLAGRRWDCIHLSGFVEGASLDRVAAMLPAARVERDARPSPYLDLEALPEGSVRAALSGNTRSQLTRCLRLYEERSGAVRLDVAQSLEEALSFLDALGRLHNVRWQQKGEDGAFASPAVTQFHRRLVARLWPQGGVDLLRIRAGDADVGYLYCFKAAGKVAFFQSGFAYDEDARMKPGLASHCLAIDHYRAAGLREYDFLAGDARYKRVFAKQHRMLAWVVVYRNTPWVRFVLLGQRVARYLASKRAVAAAPAAAPAAAEEKP